MNLADALEACLRALEDGATIEECVARYPELADDLRPLLQVAERLQDAPHATPSYAFREATRQRLLGLGRPTVDRVAVDGRVYDGPVAASWDRARRALWNLHLRPAVVGAIAALLLVVLLMNTAVSAAATSLPDSPLYPVKRASEQMQLAFTDDDWNRVQLHLKLADRRLSEAVAVPSAAPALVDDYQAQLAAALSLLIELHQSGADWSKLALLARPALARQQMVLRSGEANRLPEPTYAAATTALDTVQAWVQQLEPAAIVQVQATPTPLPTATVATPTTDISTATLTSGGNPTATPLEATATRLPPTATEPAAIVQAPPTATATPTALEVSVSAPVASPTPTVPAPTSTRTATVPAVPATATASAAANPTATRTATRVPPPATPTSAPPTATAAPTQPPPTDTPEPYPAASETPTTAPPTATPVPPSPTPVPPTATATPEPYVPPTPPPSPTPLPPNAPPSLNRLSCDPCDIQAGDRAVISAEASDPEGGGLVLEWNAFPDIRGSTLQNCPDRWNVCYLANYDMEPDDTATITVTLTVYDDAGNSASGSVQIHVSGSN